MDRNGSRFQHRPIVGRQSHSVRHTPERVHARPGQPSPPVPVSEPAARPVITERHAKHAPAVPVKPRQIVRSEPVYRPRPKRPLWYRVRERVGSVHGISALIVIVPLFSFFAGAGTILLTKKDEAKPQVKGVSRVINADSDLDRLGVSGKEAIDESPIPAAVVAGYRVSDELPQRLIIERLSVNARIRPVGISTLNALLSPANINDAGWYDASGRPGTSASTVILNGFEQGPTKAGLFAKLGSLTVGDKITIERGDGRKFTYTVREKAQLRNDQIELSELLSSPSAGSKGLVLLAQPAADNGVYRTNTQTIVYASLH